MLPAFRGFAVAPVALPIPNQGSRASKCRAVVMRIETEQPGLGLTSAIRFFSKPPEGVATLAPPRRRRPRSGAGAARKQPMQSLSEAEIALRAYYLWQNRGNPDPFLNWIEAERQLRVERDARQRSR